MTCADLCTRAQCEALQAQIDNLTAVVEQLRNDLNSHALQPVPYSHDYIPNMALRMALEGNELTVLLDLEGFEQRRTVTLPDSVVPTVTCDILPQEDGTQTLRVGVNDVFAEDTLVIEQPQLDFAITEIIPGTYDFEIVLGDQIQARDLVITYPEIDETTAQDIDFNVNVSYRFNLLTVAVTVNNVTKSSTVYIDADVINRFGGGGINISSGDDSVGCQQIADALALELGEILAAIAAVDAKVTKVQEYTTIDIEGAAVSDFECPKEAPEGEAAPEAGTEKDYEGKGIAGIHELLKINLINQLAIFEESCKGGAIAALPAWWQIRLGSNVPQIVCVFRKGATSTYHSLVIPHPLDTAKPTEVLLPAYTKGNYMGMVTCKDNSKFIINCVSEAEANRMCQAAIDIIDNEWLELPPRVYIGQRKGQAVGVAPMNPTSIEYFESGQQNTIPNWSVRIADLSQG